MDSNMQDRAIGKDTANGIKAPTESVFKGTLQRPGESARKFMATEVTLHPDLYQIKGLTKESGSPEWIVININTDQSGTFTVSPASEIGAPIGVGGVIDGEIMQAISGTITLKQGGDVKFKAADFSFKFELSSGREGEFEEGVVSIPNLN
ncbi:hypothetical protein ACIQAL_24150 [Pseudomonas sp. NPDC088368]|uniref:hypothetical protein n=1 Tax=Pseudomonas sp. NPDC088368 TaxID=3364453 RepID=UPI0037F9B258